MNKKEDELEKNKEIKEKTIEIERENKELEEIRNK